MVSFNQTISFLKADYCRRLLLEKPTASFVTPITVLFRRGMLAVVLYRLNRFCYFNRLKVFCKLIAWLDFILTKSEISPIADIGPGLVLGDAGMHGLTRVLVAGKNCTFLGFNTITLGAVEGLNPLEDKVRIGDHCVLGYRVRVMRPVVITDGTQVMPNSVVIMSVDKVGATLSGIPAKRQRIDSYEDIVNWNPLLGGKIQST